MQKTTTNI